jgi:hypothetical protein
MPKRKASFSSLDSNDDHDAKRLDRCIGSQSTSSILLSDKPSGRLRQATLVGNQNISSGLSIDSFPTCVKANNVHEGPFWPQNPAKDTVACRNLAAKSSLAILTTEYPQYPPSSYPLFGASHPENPSAHPTLSSSTLATANNVRPDSRIPQMTCRLFSLRPSLGADIIWRPEIQSASEES